VTTSRDRGASDIVVQEILDRLRADGGRITPARRALVAELVCHGGHPTAEELGEAVRVSHPDVHQATVYRILDDLERIGAVVHTHLGHGPAVYHLADSAHAHLVCDGCGAVIEADPALFRHLATGVAGAHGFVIAPGHFAVTGRCRACN
jgi:Fe2+ or Zn2+ uptake regulation protein